MGSLGLPATTMAVRSAFALLCFALLCGLAASSVGQSETETELTKKEGEAAGNQVLVAEALESRVARGSKGNQNQRSKACRRDPQSNKCLRQKTRKNQKKGKTVRQGNRNNKGKRQKENKGNKKGKRGNKNRNKKTSGKTTQHGRKNKKGTKKIEKQIKKREKKLARKLKKTKKKENKENNKEKFARKGNTKASKASNATVNLTCLTTAIQLLKFQKDNVNNFLARHTRQQKQNALTTKKQGKKGEFAEPAARLIQAGGGNKSNLTCGGSTTSTGAKQLLNLTDLLDGCSAAIKDACTPPTGINQTFMAECFEKSKGFNTTLSGCVSTAMSGSDPCSCFTDAKLVGAMTKLKPCKGKDEAKLAAKARTKCLGQMRACNGYVETAGRLQYTCKYTADDLKKTLAQITANNATVAAAMAKVKALTGVEGSDGSSNSSRRAREVGEMAHEEENIAPMDAVQQLMGFQGRHLGKREIRAKRATFTCSSMTTAVQTCTTAVSSTPSGSTVISSCTIETTQTSITCSDAEKTALQTISNTLIVAQRIFTAFTISILSELSESAGATPSTSELESLVNEITTGTSTKAASSRNRNMLRQLVLDKMKN